MRSLYLHQQHNSEHNDEENHDSAAASDSGQRFVCHKGLIDRYDGARLQRYSQSNTHSQVSAIPPMCHAPPAQQATHWFKEAEDHGEGNKRQDELRPHMLRKDSSAALEYDDGNHKQYCDGLSSTQPRCTGSVSMAFVVTARHHGTWLILFSRQVPY